MTTAARPGRARRGRVMIVGDIPDLSRLAQQLLQPPVVARNLFEALGEITVAPAGSPITTVLLSDQLLQPHAGRAVEAMRKIDPSLRVVLITSNAMSLDWQSKGLDDCVSTPLAPGDLTRLFDEDMIAPAAAIAPVIEQVKPTPPLQAASTAPEPQTLVYLAKSAETAGTAEKAPRPERSDSAAPRLETKAAEFAAKEEPGAEAQPRQAAPAAAQLELGDTDLVEAMLTSPAGVREIALKLIVQQTNWSDIALVQERQSSPLGAEVSFNDQTFGFLRSHRATVAQLQPWAQWLARWLALDERYREYRMKSFQDDLTGAWNRRFFESFLRDSIARAGKLRRQVSVMVFDIDNFKTYNDNFGHEAGDEVLRETVRLLNSVIRQGDRVCRIGGDEFAVVFADPEGPRKPDVRGAGAPPESVEVIARRFQDQICKMRFPKLGEQAPGPLSISAGLATYPWDGNDPVALLRHADQLALESKRKGKNAITLGPGAMRACREESAQ